MGIQGVKITNVKKNQHLLLTETYLYETYKNIDFEGTNIKCIDIFTCVTNVNTNNVKLDRQNWKKLGSQDPGS